MLKPIAPVKTRVHNISKKVMRATMYTKFSFGFEEEDIDFLFKLFPHPHTSIKLAAYHTRAFR